MRKNRNNLILRMKNIHAYYENAHALKGIDFDLYPGEIHALIGEHRAGKSTLVRILSGALQKDEGEIILKNRKINLFSPKYAIRNSIGTVYQNLNIIPNVNAVKNIFAGRMLINKFGFINLLEMKKKVENTFKELGLDIDMETPLYNLSLWEQYIVEFVRILVIDPDIIILDEISSKFTPEEMKLIYKVIYKKKESGKSIIYISHNINEILELADRVTILKNGLRMGTEKVKDLDKYRLFQLTYSFASKKDELDDIEKKLVHLRKYFENIIENIPLGVIILNSGKKIQMINSTTLKILKLNQHNIFNEPVGRVIKHLNSKVLDEIDKKIDSNTNGYWENISTENDALINLNIFPLKESEYSFLGTIIVIEDVSLKQNLKNYLIESEKKASVAEVAVGVAHEINNPLYIMKNYFELIYDEKLNEPVLEKLKKIEHMVDRIVEIVSSLLSFSKIRKIPGNKVDLVNIISEALILLHHSLKKKNIKVKKDLHLEKALIIGDENRLKQLFINIINNSIDAVLEYGTIGVEIDRLKDLKKIKVKFIDNGCGISKEVQGQIFNPFFSTKINKRNTGLGLSICRHIVEEHNGEISFSSIPSRQTVFELDFNEAV